MCVEVSFKHPSIITLFALATLVLHLMRCCSQVSIEMQETMLLLLAISTLHANLQTSIHNYHFQQSALFVEIYNSTAKSQRRRNTYLVLLSTRGKWRGSKRCVFVSVLVRSILYSVYMRVCNAMQCKSGSMVAVLLLNHFTDFYTTALNTSSRYPRRAV